MSNLQDALLGYFAPYNTLRDELTETMKALAGAEAPQDKAAKQGELLKSAYERAVANTRELGDLIQRANGEALGALNQRVSEAIDEMKSLLKPDAKK